MTASSKRRVIAKLVSDATRLGELTHRRRLLENAIEGIDLSATQFEKRQSELLDKLRKDQEQPDPRPDSIGHYRRTVLAVKIREEVDFLDENTRMIARSRRLYAEDAREVNRRIADLESKIQTNSEKLIG
jgi:hypothetical protein